MTMSKDIKDRLSDALISAFTFAAALSWRESLMSLVDYYLPNEVSRLWADIVISTIITAIVILIIYFVLKANQVADERLKMFSDTDEEVNKKRKYD